MTIPIQTTRAFYGAHVQSSLYIGKDHVPLPNSTINQRFDIHKDSNPQAGERNVLSFMCIGDGALRNGVGGGGKPRPSIAPHRIRDAGLFSYLPFVMRPVAEDLDAVTRQRYAMRVPMTVNGVNYWAYYLKRLDMTNVQPEAKHIVTVGGTSTITPYVPTNQDLTPPVPEVSNTGVTTTDGEYLQLVTIIDASITAADRAEFMDAIRILYDNDDLMGVISEIGLVSSVRRSVQLLDFNRQPTSGQYFEAIHAQLNHFANGLWHMAYSNTGVEIKLNVGATLPMFGPNQVAIAPGP